MACFTVTGNLASVPSGNLAGVPSSNLASVPCSRTVSGDFTGMPGLRRMSLITKPWTMESVFADIDVLACPSMPEPPFLIEKMAPFAPMDEQGLDMQLLRFTAPYDFNGAPTLSVPCGLSSEGLPLSLQLVGKHLEEWLICRIGHAYEQATEWHDLHPPI